MAAPSFMNFEFTCIDGCMVVVRYFPAGWNIFTLQYKHKDGSLAIIRDITASLLPQGKSVTFFVKGQKKTFTPSDSEDITKLEIEFNRFSLPVIY